MLRDFLRGFLAEHWNADVAAKQSSSPEAISAIWTRLVGQGVASLGCDFSEGGLCEILVVMAELGRAACPAPMWSAALTNLSLSDCQAEAAVALLEKLHDGTARWCSRSARSTPMPMPARFSLWTAVRAGCCALSKSRGSCTHLVVAIEASGIAIVALDGPGVELEADPGDGRLGDITNFA